MTVTRAGAHVVAALVLLVASQQQALALPTMIRLGYSECSACHISPQGGGPLNTYGRGIDRAQSLRGGEYVPATDNLWRVLTFGGRTTEDLRTVLKDQGSHEAGASVQTDLWPRLMYRNDTEIGKGVRLSGTITGENGSAPRPDLSYDPRSAASSVFVNTALLNYHAGQTLEFSAGRDQLPSGINVPDLTLWIKARNRLGYYDAPTQLKMFWTASRIHLTPFVYASGGNERSGDRETGAGTLVEVVLGPQRTVLGTSVLSASSPNGDRQLVGGYARLGFGRWGILAEQDFTERTRVVPQLTSFGQSASYGQLFWAAREWLVASVVGERLHVNQPFEEKLLASKLDLTARLASQATVDLTTGVQLDQITGRVSTSVTLQLAFKTVQ